MLETYVKRSPRSLPARVALSALHREGSAYDRALAHARAALLITPGDLDAMLEVGRTYRAMTELDVADLVFQKAALLDAKSPRPHNELGLTALARGDTQLAFQRFEQALSLDGTFGAARMNRAGVLVRVGSYERAATEYRRVLEQDEAHPGARVGLGISLRGLGKHAEAASEYERVLRAEPNNVAALFDLAVVEREHLSKPEQAKKHFEQFLEVAPDGAAKEYAERALEDSAPSAEGGS